jgi:tripartite-type tricarboxylate transporter receptor subunit TctC
MAAQRRLTWHMLAAGCAFAACIASAHAQPFPSRPIHLIVSFPPGGPADISARAISDGLAGLLGHPVVVENRPGAGAVAATQALLSALPDGHTLMLASNVLSTGTFLYKSVTFDPLKDVRAVVGISRSPHLVVVSPDFRGNGIDDLIRFAKEQPGKLNCATAGAGTMPHLGVELFQQVTGTQMTLIPYKGSGAALPAVMGGQVDVYFDIMFSAATLVKAGKLKALGVTGLQRADTFPEVPTLDEQGVKGFELYSTFGVVAHAGTPDTIVSRLNEAINKVLATPSVRARLATLGATPIGGPPQAFQKMIDDDYNNWGKVIRAAGIVPE